MAVYQGTRLRTSALPAAEASTRQTRATAPPSVSTTPRVRPMGLLMAAIVATTILGLVYLTQTLGTNATSTEIRSLQGKQSQILTDINRSQIAALLLTQADEIIPLAKKQNLKRLDRPEVLPAP